MHISKGISDMEAYFYNFQKRPDSLKEQTFNSMTIQQYVQFKILVYCISIHCVSKRLKKNPKKLYSCFHSGFKVNNPDFCPVTVSSELIQCVRMASSSFKEWKFLPFALPSDISLRFQHVHGIYYYIHIHIYMYVYITSKTHVYKIH